jgi:hypothetical protein
VQNSVAGIPPGGQAFQQPGQVAPDGLEVPGVRIGLDVDGDGARE